MAVFRFPRGGTVDAGGETACFPLAISVPGRLLEECSVSEFKAEVALAVGGGWFESAHIFTRLTLTVSVHVCMLHSSVLHLLLRVYDLHVFRPAEGSTPPRFNNVKRT